MTLVRSGTILFISSMVGNIANYLFQFFMSRYLSLEDYGAMNAAFSLMVIIGIPTSTIMFVVAKYISTFNARGQDDKLSSLYRASLTRMTTLGALLFSPFLLFNRQIAGYLNIDDGWPVIIVGVAIFLTFALTINLGMLQGLKKFYYFGMGMGLNGLLKLIFGVIFIVIGFGLNGAVASVVFSSLVVLALTTIPVSFYLLKRPIPLEKHTKDIFLYSVPVFFSTLAFTVLTNIDLIFIKHFFSPQEAGLYAAVAVLGKIILYLPAAFVLALFPIVSESHASNQDTFKILDKGLLYTTAISLVGVLGFIFIPDITIKILFGSKFIVAAPLMKFYGMAMMLMSIISILVSFNLARDKTGFIYSLIIGCILLIILISFFHNTLFQVLYIILIVNSCLTAFNLYMVYQDRKAFYRLKTVDLESAER